MIKYIFMIKRKPGISVQDFRRHWEDTRFRELVSEVGKLLGATNLHLSLVLDIDFNKTLSASRGVADSPFDAVMEYLLPSAKELDSIVASDAFKDVFSKLEALEATFMDFEHSQRCFTEFEDPLIS